MLVSKTNTNQKRWCKIDYEDVVRYDGKKVLIILKNHYKYQGTIKQVKHGSLILNDKFKQDVLIALDIIKVLSEDDGVKTW